MIPLGIPLTAAVKAIESGRCILDIEGQDIPLNIWELPKRSKPGRELEVTVYNDSKESLKATRLTPFVRPGEFAPLKVKSVNEWGAFLEWGLPKDLFLPVREQAEPVRRGQRVVVWVMLDHEKKGLIASTKLGPHFDYEPSGLEENDPVSLLIFNEIKIGFGAVVNGRYRGILYRTDLFRDIRVGETWQGVVKKFREDGRIDCSLQAQGFKHAIEENTEFLLDALTEAKGYLPLHDKSSPEEIAEKLHMSKKNFKKAAGVLYKEGRITIEPGGLRLKS